MLINPTLGRNSGATLAKSTLGTHVKECKEGVLPTSFHVGKRLIYRCRVRVEARSLIPATLCEGSKDNINGDEKTKQWERYYAGTSGSRLKRHARINTDKQKLSLLVEESAFFDYGNGRNCEHGLQCQETNTCFISSHGRFVDENVLKDFKQMPAS